MPSGLSGGSVQTSPKIAKYSLVTSGPSATRSHDKGHVSHDNGHVVTDAHGPEEWESDWEDFPDSPMADYSGDAATSSSAISANFSHFSAVLEVFSTSCTTSTIGHVLEGLDAPRAYFEGTPESPGSQAGPPKAEKFSAPSGQAEISVVLSELQGAKISAPSGQTENFPVPSAEFLEAQQVVLEDPCDRPTCQPTGQTDPGFGVPTFPNLSTWGPGDDDSLAPPSEYATDLSTEWGDDTQDIPDETTEENELPIAYICMLKGKGGGKLGGGGSHKSRTQSPSTKTRPTWGERSTMLPFWGHKWPFLSLEL